MFIREERIQIDANKKVASIHIEKRSREKEELTEKFPCFLRRVDDDGEGAG